MQITKIYIKAFGLFADFTFVPSEGMNMIYCPNESGKSTLLDFIRYIFYGANQRKKVSGLTFKEKYMPWGGFSMGGFLEFETGGVKYVVERSDGIRPSDKKLKVFNLTSARELKGVTEPGVTFLGIDEKTFFSTYFITDVHCISKDNQDGSLVSILSSTSGEQTVYSKIRKNISDKYKAISSSKSMSSQMNKISRSINETGVKIAELHDEKQRLEATVSKNKDLNRNIAELEQQKEKYSMLKKMRKLSALKQQKRDEEKLLEALKSELDKVDYENNELNEADKKILTEDFSQETLRVNVYIMISVVLFLASVALAVTAVISDILLLLIISFFVISCGALCTGKALKLNKKRKYLMSQKKSVFDKSGVKTYNEYILRMEKKETMNANMDNIKKQIAFSEARIHHIQGEIFDLEDSMKESGFDTENFVETNSFTNHDINVIITKIESDINQLKKENDENEYSLKRIGHLREIIQNLQIQYDHLTERRSFLEKQMKIYEYALLILDSAFDEIKNDVIPVISEKASEIFSDISDSAYDSLMVTDAFSAFVYQNNSCHSSSFLSTGAQDIIDFSIRLAVIEYMSGSVKSPPLFMDDPFMATDDERCMRLLDLIGRRSAKQQIFFTTCRSREGTYWNKNTDVNTVTFQKG